MKTLFIVFFFLFSLKAFSQVPEPIIYTLSTYGGNNDDDIATIVTKTQDGGFIINLGSNSAINTGTIDSFCNIGGYRDIYLKYNSDGSLLEWYKCFTTGGYIYPVSNNNFIYGTATDPTSGWAFVIGLEDSIGNVIWKKNYGTNANALLHSIIATNDGGYILMGTSNYIDTDFTIHYGSSVYADIAVIKVDSNGNKMWAKVIGGSQEEEAITIVPGPADGCYIIGTTLSDDYNCTGNHGGDDIYLARLDVNGNILWHNDIGGSGGDNGAWAVADGKGGILIAGASNSPDGDRTVFQSYGCPIWALQVDSNNNILWNNCYGGGGSNCYANSICKATDGSIWIAGVSSIPGAEVDTNYGKDDAWFVHTDSIGNLINAKVLGSDQDDEGTMIYPLSNGNVIAGGFYDTAGGALPNIWFGGDDAFLTVFAPGTTGIESIAMKNSLIKIYPNPTNEQFTIEAKDKNNIIITDAVGRILYNKNIQNKIEIQVNGWQKGIYFVQAISEEGYKEVKKLIVE